MVEAQRGRSSSLSESIAAEPKLSEVDGACTEAVAGVVGSPVSRGSWHRQIKRRPMGTYLHFKANALGMNI